MLEWLRFFTIWNRSETTALKHAMCVLPQSGDCVPTLPVGNQALVLTCQRVLAIPVKRTKKRMVDDLAPVESSALLAAPDRSTWIGRRDRCLLVVA